MRKNSSKSPNPFKTRPSSPHVEVKDQNGILLPVSEVVIDEDADGVFFIHVGVQLPKPQPSMNMYSSSGRYRSPFGPTKLLK